MKMLMPLFVVLVALSVSSCAHNVKMDSSYVQSLLNQIDGKDSPIRLSEQECKRLNAVLSDSQKNWFCNFFEGETWAYYGRKGDKLYVDMVSVIRFNHTRERFVLVTLDRKGRTIWSSTGTQDASDIIPELDPK